MYAELTTRTLLPLLLKMWKPGPAEAGQLNLFGDTNSDLFYLAALAVAPLQSPEFLGGLPREKVQAWLPRWTALREQAPDDATRLGFDLILLAANQSLGRDAERNAVAERVAKNPLGKELLPENGDLDPAARLRQFMTTVLPVSAKFRESLRVN
jgi:hypothetical protein